MVRTYISILVSSFPCSRSHAVTSDLDIVDTAKAAEFFCSDGVVITGKETGVPADISDIERVSAAVSLPVVVGSGVTDENIHSYASKVRKENSCSVHKLYNYSCMIQSNLVRTAYLLVACSLGCFVSTCRDSFQFANIEILEWACGRDSTNMYNTTCR